VQIEQIPDFMLVLKGIAKKRGDTVPFDREILGIRKGM
jgi:hypothetical protein